MIHPQLQQLINLLIVLLLGKYVAHVYLSWVTIVFILFFTLFVEYLMIYFKEKEFMFFSFSSISTAIGVMLMLVTPHIWIIMVIIVLGLVQKHFLQWKQHHFFNPSNFALMMGLLFFYNDAHIVLGQLGDEPWLVGLVILLGISILLRVDRWIIPLVFSISYLFLQYVFIVSSDPVLIMDEIIYRFYSVSFIVFILFMLTDPKTTPQKYWQQIFFSVFIALEATWLDHYYGFRVQHLFMSLFILSIFVPSLTVEKEETTKQQLFIVTAILLLLVLSAIIYIEIQPPYYFEMDG